MSFPLAIVSAATELSRVSGLGTISRWERQARPSRDPGLAWIQIQQSSLAFSFANRVLEILGRKPISSSYRWATYLIPPALYFLEQKLPSGQVKKATRFLQRNLGTLFYTASVVSHIAFVYFSGSGLALATLAFLVVDGLHMHRLMPSRISKLYSSLRLPFAFSVGALAEGTAWKAASFSASFVFNHALSSLIIPPRAPKGNSGVLTPEFFDRIVKSQKPFDLFEINVNHLGSIKVPAPSNVELNEFLSEWDKCHRQLPRPLEGPVAAHFRGLLAKRIEDLMNTDPSWKKTYIFQAKHVLEALQEEASPEDKVKLLIKIAQDENFIEEHYSHLVTKPNSPTPLRDEILSTPLALRVALSQDPRMVGFFKLVGQTNGLRADLKKDCGYTAKSMFREASDLPDFSAKVRAWWKSFLAEKDADTRRAFETALAQKKGPRHNLQAQSPHICQCLVAAMMFEMGLIQRGAPRASRLAAQQSRAPGPLPI